MPRITPANLPPSQPNKGGKGQPESRARVIRRQIKEGIYDVDARLDEAIKNLVEREGLRKEDKEKP